MNKKLTRLECYQEISVQLARIEAKVDKILSVFVATKEVDNDLSVPNIVYTCDPIKSTQAALDYLIKISGNTEKEHPYTLEDAFNDPSYPRSFLDNIPYKPEKEKK